MHRRFTFNQKFGKFRLGTNGREISWQKFPRIWRLLNFQKAKHSAESFRISLRGIPKFSGNSVPFDFPRNISGLLGWMVCFSDIQPSPNAKGYPFSGNSVKCRSSFPFATGNFQKCNRQFSVEKKLYPFSVHSPTRYAYDIMVIWRDLGMVNT